MSRIFNVVIHYEGGAKETLPVIAIDDVIARQEAIRYDRDGYLGHPEWSRPAILFCEITLLVETVN